MRKPILYLFILMIPLFTFAGSGTLGTDALALIIEDNLSSAITYQTGTLQGASLSSTSTSLKIKDITVKTYENGGDVVNSVIFYYRVYPTGSPTGVFIAHPLSAVTALGGGNKQFDIAAGGLSDLQLIFGLNNSTNYTLECYAVLDVNTFDVVLVRPGTGNYNTNNINQYYNNGAVPSPLPNTMTYKATFITATTLSLNNIANFTAQYNQNKVALKWDMLSSTGLEKLVLQRSGNGASWQNLNTYNVVNAAPNSFFYLDANPSDGLNLYRVVGYNATGSETFSKILRINIAIIDNSLQVFPIPALNHVDVLMNGIKKGTYKAFVYGNDGKRVLLSSFEHDGFMPQRRFTIPSTLQAGSYILMIQNKKEFYKQQIIKK